MVYFFQKLAKKEKISEQIDLVKDCEIESRTIKSENTGSTHKKKPLESSDDNNMMPNPSSTGTL